MKEVFIVGIVFFSIYSIFKLLSNHSIKKLLIKNNMVDQSDKLIIKDAISESGNKTSLKWGIIALFTGVGVLVATSLYPMLRSYGDDSWYLVEGVIPSIVLIFISAGFLSYFFISRKVK